jgi:hypothetical protein
LFFSFFRQSTINNSTTETTDTFSIMSISDSSAASTDTDDIMERLQNGHAQFSPSVLEDNAKKPEDEIGNALEETPQSQKIAPTAAIRSSPRQLTQRSLNEHDLASGDGAANKKKRGRTKGSTARAKKKTTTNAPTNTTTSQEVETVLGGVPQPPPKKKPKPSSARGVGYSKDEVDNLLCIIDDVLPVGPDQWTKVLDLHAEKFGDQCRDNISIKRKFAKLAKSTCPTGDPNCPADVRFAKRIHREIVKKMDAAAEVEDSEIGFPEDQPFPSVEAGGRTVEEMAANAASSSPPRINRTSVAPTSSARRAQVAHGGAMKEDPILNLLASRMDQERAERLLRDEDRRIDSERRQEDRERELERRREQRELDLERRREEKQQSHLMTMMMMKMMAAIIPGATSDFDPSLFNQQVPSSTNNTQQQQQSTEQRNTDDDKDKLDKKKDSKMPAVENQSIVNQPNNNDGNDEDDSSKEDFYN